MIKHLSGIPDSDRDVYGETFTHLNNKKLKTADTIFPYQQIHIDEMWKCERDILYFANNFYHTVHQDEGLIQIKLREYQINSLNAFSEHRFNICKWCRQSGKCVYKSMVYVRNKKTGEIFEMKIENFYKYCKTTKANKKERLYYGMFRMFKRIFKIR